MGEGKSITIRRLKEALAATVALLVASVLVVALLGVSEAATVPACLLLTATVATLLVLRPVPATAVTRVRSLPGAIAAPAARTAAARRLERSIGAVEARTPGTRGHSRRVARYAAGVARRMGLSRRQVRLVRRAAALHDVGKVETPAEILDKPQRLSDAEWVVVRRHAATGAAMVTQLGDAKLAAIVRHHHERVDGCGYPDRLGGEQIPLGARIVAVADTFDAVTSGRLYEPRRSRREALDLLRAEAGSQLDPRVVRAFHDYCLAPRPAHLWSPAIAAVRRALAAARGEAPSTVLRVHAGRLNY